MIGTAALVSNKHSAIIQAISSSILSSTVGMSLHLIASSPVPAFGPSHLHRVGSPQSTNPGCPAMIQGRDKIFGSELSSNSLDIRWSPKSKVQ